MTLFAVANGWSSAKVNFPDEFSNAYGELTTTWVYSGSIGLLDSTRKQVLTWDNYIAQRNYTSDGWSVWNVASTKKPYIKIYTITPSDRSANILDERGNGIHKGYLAGGNAIKLEAFTIGTGYANYSAGILTSAYFQEIANFGDADNAVDVYMDAYGYLKIAFPTLQSQNYQVVTIMTVL